MMFMRKKFVWIGLLVSQIFIGSVSYAVEQSDKSDKWWEGAVFYEVFVRSFYDSKEGKLGADGVGDIAGLIEKLDYLNDGDPETANDLGVNAIWLMPVMESPSYHGYDVVDYYSVDEEYGSKADFKRLMHEAHKRGIKVIVDLVINHGSVEHPYFVYSENKKSKYRDWFTWVDSDPGVSGPWNQPVWHERNDAYYYGIFWHGMPDWNLENPDVTQEFYNISKFWMNEMGVDGFRLDAIRFFVEEGSELEDTAGTHKWLRTYYRFLKDLDPSFLTVGEAWANNHTLGNYAVNQSDLLFQFELGGGIINAINFGSGRYLRHQLVDIHKRFKVGKYATFLSNHDQRRVMGQLDQDTVKAKLAAKILLTIPGVPFIYYGEEIGMIGDKPDEDIRTPMQWSNKRFSDFSTVSPWRDVNPDFGQKNVQHQMRNVDSLWNVYQSHIALRQKHAALHSGDIQWVMSNSDKVAAYLREHDDESLLIIVNLAEEPVENVKFFKKDEWNIAGRLTNSNDIKLDDQAKVIKFPSIPVGHFEVYSLTKPVK